MVVTAKWLRNKMWFYNGNGHITTMDQWMDGRPSLPSMVVVKTTIHYLFRVRQNGAIMAYNSFLLPFGMWPLGLGLNPLSCVLDACSKSHPFHLS